MNEKRQNTTTIDRNIKDRYKTCQQLTKKNTEIIKKIILLLYYTMTIRFDDLLVAGNVLDSNKHELSVKVFGPPPVQQRPKIVWKKRSWPTYYDPSAIAKRNWRYGLKNELVDCGHLVFPFF